MAPAQSTGCCPEIRSGYRLAYSRAWKELKKGIQLAKQRYYFDNNNPHNMWRGIRTITDSNTTSSRSAMTPLWLSP